MINSLKIYLNTGEGQVNITGLDNNEKDIGLFDMTGKLTLKEPVHGEAALLYLHGVNSGLYLLKVGSQT